MWMCALQVSCIASSMVIVIRGQAEPIPCSRGTDIDKSWLYGWCRSDADASNMFHNMLLCAKTIDFSDDTQHMHGKKAGILQALLQQIDDQIMKPPAGRHCNPTEIWALSCFASHVCHLLDAKQVWLTAK